MKYHPACLQRPGAAWLEHETGERSTVQWCRRGTGQGDFSLTPVPPGPHPGFSSLPTHGLRDFSGAQLPLPQAEKQSGTCRCGLTAVQNVPKSRGPDTVSACVLLAPEAKAGRPDGPVLPDQSGQQGSLILWFRHVLEPVHSTSSCQVRKVSCQGRCTQDHMGVPRGSVTAATWRDQVWVSCYTCLGGGGVCVPREDGAGGW